MQEKMGELATAAGAESAELDAVIDEFKTRITANGDLEPEEKTICLTGLERFGPFYTMVVVAMLSSTDPMHSRPPLQQYLIELAERETNVMEQFNTLPTDNPEIVTKFITACKP